MTNGQKLWWVKLIHTIIWVGYNVVIFYMLWLVLTGQLTPMLWAGYILVSIEGLVLLYFKFTCPLTLVARQYTTDARANFDIFLPEWLAKYTQRIYTSIMIVILLITLYQLLE